MNLEKNIKDVIAKQMEEGMVEKLVAEQLEKGISKALENLFSSYGDVTGIIKSKLKSVIVPYLENYDYSKYITKLDYVLVEVLQNTTLENRNLLNNFKELMSEEAAEKTVKLSDLFAKWMNYVAKNVETDGLEVEFDDGPEYEAVEVSVNVERNEDRSWSSFEHATILFECDHDEEMNFEIPISFYKNGTDKEWDLRYNSVHDLKSIRHLNEFEILLMRLSQNGVGIILDIEWENDAVTPEEEPEPSF
ncbi:hypothetical protein [Bacillus inaquosorum]|uniref:hypothetical protein n=1 Tax=Bacillus inaquosorum TaxID=483913 RepID=UPI0022832307|nr:hypothetical protein [Bacillus inaquosorum]MCY7819011.1 hypothetical protein [Bacillus inaquosorum]